jgi:hypothetical protein
MQVSQIERTASGPDRLVENDLRAEPGLFL